VTLSSDGEKFLARCGLTADQFREVLVPHPCPPHLVLGLIHTESGGNPDALRYEPGYQYHFEPTTEAKVHGWTTPTEVALQSFSYGLMQIMLATARERGFHLHPKLLFVPKINVAWGTFHLFELRRRFSSWENAVAAYNWGHPAKKLLSPVYKNQDYVDKVFAAAGKFEAVFES